jgi:hypothetical protein
MSARVRESLKRAGVPIRHPLVCRFCLEEAVHNEVLRISYCRVHGLSSPLDEKGATPRRFEVARAAEGRNETAVFQLGSWAIPAG